MDNFEVIANGFTEAMKREKATNVYNHFSSRLHVTEISEARELLALIRELQETDDYLLGISKGE